MTCRNCERTADDLDVDHLCAGAQVAGDLRRHRHRRGSLVGRDPCLLLRATSRSTSAVGQAASSFSRWSSFPSGAPL